MHRTNLDGTEFPKTAYGCALRRPERAPCAGTATTARARRSKCSIRVPQRYKCTHCGCSCGRAKCRKWYGTRRRWETGRRGWAKGREELTKSRRVEGRRYLHARGTCHWTSGWVRGARLQLLGGLARASAGVPPLGRQLGAALHELENFETTIEVLASRTFFPSASRTLSSCCRPSPTLFLVVLLFGLSFPPRWFPFPSHSSILLRPCLMAQVGLTYRAFPRAFHCSSRCVTPPRPSIGSSWRWPSESLSSSTFPRSVRLAFPPNSSIHSYAPDVS